MRLTYHISGIGKRERDRWWPGFQCVPERFRVQRLWNVIDGIWPTRQFSHHVDIALDGGGRSEERSDPSKPTFVRHGSRKLCRGTSPHGGQDDWHFNAE